MIIVLGLFASVLALFIVGSYLIDFNEENYNENKCSMVDYEIADTLNH